ncbi:MAG: hypothetical protein DRI99_03085 [Candidatus Aminicenantes bacterium]|nr:MAG: hypothetical protein DRI99_03085 [Candidatus Aminicenantes bacterium]
MIKEETEKRKADKPLPTKVPQEGIRKIITAGRKLLRYLEEHHKAINMILTIIFVSLIVFNAYIAWCSLHPLYFHTSNKDNVITVVNGGTQLVLIKDIYIHYDGGILNSIISTDGTWTLKQDAQKELLILHNQPITKRGYKEGHIICSFCYKGREVTIIYKCGLFFEPPNNVIVIIK